jgi:hypothetical protein
MNGNVIPEDAGRHGDISWKSKNRETAAGS